MEYRWTNLSLLQWKKIQYVNMGIINLVPEVELPTMIRNYIFINKNQEMEHYLRAL